VALVIEHCSICVLLLACKISC